MYQKKSIIHFCHRPLGRLICFENLFDITKFSVYCLRGLTNPDVTQEAEHSLKVINEEINSFSNFEEQISLEKGELNNILYDYSSFPDVIDTDSCWRSYWQEVATHEKIDLDVEVIEDPDNKYFCPYYVKKLFELIFLVPIWDKLLKTFEEAEEKEQLNFYNKEEKI